jgi:membrane-bound metal-dependent hydrolase YbcI (DUF457 family)
MTSLTHIPFGLLTSEFACSSFEFEMDGRSLAIAAIASLLPDIDHPRSAVGRTLSFTGLPQFIEERVGHRSITHSWLFLLVALILLIPLWYVWGLLYYLSAWFGILSHILIDMVNISGVPLFWPIRTRWVFPPAERFRIAVGTPAEFILAAILIVATTAFTPISIMGLRSSFYLLTRDIYSASREARRFFPDYELTCQIRGTWRDTLLPTNYEERFRVVAVEQSNLYFARADAVFATGGPSPSATIDRILVERDRPIVRSAETFEIDHFLLDEVADKISDSAIITGHLIVEKLDADQKAADYIVSSEEFATVTSKARDQHADEIDITYCPSERFRKALLNRGIFVMQGVITVTSAREVKKP